MSEGLNSDPDGDVGGVRGPAQTRFLAMAEHLRPFLDRALGAWPEDVTLLATRAGTRRRATRAPGHPSPGQGLPPGPCRSLLTADRT